MNLVWRVADDPDVVHALIEASDRRAAQVSGTTPPRRRRESTEALVACGFTHLGLLGRRPAATVTLGDAPPFDLAVAGLPAAADPRYMQRLAVDPEAGDPLLGFHAVRHVLGVATVTGADAVRCEANPDLGDVLRLLRALGFERHGSDLTGPAPRTWLQRRLTP